MHDFRCLKLWRLLLGAAIYLLVSGAQAEPHASLSRSPVPERVVSLNLCSDELLLMLADPRQIQSLTWLARDSSLSWLSEQASAFPANYGQAEEIVALKPDLVLAGVFTAPATLAMLERFQVPVVKLKMPTTLLQVMQQIEDVAELLGQERRGADLVADMRQRLHSLPELPAGVRPTVALYQPNGLTAGAGTLVDDAFQYAGLDNLAVIRALPRYTQLSLELLLVDKPSVLVMNQYDPDAPSLAQELQHHPSLKKSFTASQTVIVPSQAWTCGTPHIVQAVEILRSAAVSHMAAR